MSWQTPRTWVANEKISASLLNTHWRDQISWIATAGITGWESYTPSWTANTTNPVIGNGTLAGSYCQIGKTVYGEARLTCGSTTTYGSGTNYYWTLPVTAKSALRQGGGGIIADASPAADHTAFLIFTADATTFQLFGNEAPDSADPTHPITWTTSDSMRSWFIYEAA